MRNEIKWEAVRSKSQTQGTAKRDNRTVKMTPKQYKARIKRIAAIAAVSTLIIIGGGTALTNSIADSITISKMTHDFKAEFIDPATHWTAASKTPTYDYESLAQAIQSMDSIEEGVYYILNILGTDETSRVLSYTEYGSFPNLMEAKHYKSITDFKKKTEKGILGEIEINDKKTEIEKMQEEHKTDEERLAQLNGKGK